MVIEAVHILSSIFLSFFPPYIIIIIIFRRRNVFLIVIEFAGIFFLYKLCCRKKSQLKMRILLILDVCLVNLKLFSFYYVTASCLSTSSSAHWLQKTFKLGQLIARNWLHLMGNIVFVAIYNTCTFYKDFFSWNYVSIHEGVCRWQIFCHL